MERLFELSLSLPKPHVSKDSSQSEKNTQPLLSREVWRPNFARVTCAQCFSLPGRLWRLMALPQPPQENFRERTNRTRVYRRPSESISRTFPKYAPFGGVLTANANRGKRRVAFLRRKVYSRGSRDSVEMGAWVVRMLPSRFGPGLAPGRGSPSPPIPSRFGPGLASFSAARQQPLGHLAIIR